MDKQKLSKGFALTEFLIAILIVSILTILAPNIKRDLHINTAHKHFENAYVRDKFNSMINVESKCIENNNIISKYPICFNGRGNINQAQTIQILSNATKYTIHLGSGVYEIKSR